MVMAVSGMQSRRRLRLVAAAASIAKVRRCPWALALEPGAADNQPRTDGG